MFNVSVTRFSSRLHLPIAFDLEWRLNARGMMVVLPALLALLLWLMWGEWQGFVESAWVRLGTALCVFLAPGFALQQLLWRGADVSFSQRAVVGFGVSVGLTGVLGLLATALHLAMPFVIAGLSVVLIVCALVWAARQGWQWRFRVQPEMRAASLLMWIVAWVACAIVAYLSVRRVIDGDDLTYNVYVVHWLESARWDWNDIFFDAQHLATSRFWLAYWMLDEALLARWSAVPALELTRVYLPPFLSVLALMATYALARRFDLSRMWSGFALTMQATSVLLLTGMDQPGFVFLNRVVEDKSVAAFILTSVFVLAVTAFFVQQTKGRWLLAAFIGFAFVLTHPTMLAVAVVAVGLYTVLYCVIRRDWRTLFAISLLLGLLILVPLLIRIFDAAYTSKIPFDVSELTRKDQLRRLVSFGAAWFILNPEIIWGLPFLWTLVAGIVGAFQLRQSHIARWVFTAMVIVLSVLNPVTVFLWGMTISASHVWRIVWIVPFGIAAAFLSKWAFERICRNRAQTIAHARLQIVVALASSVCLLGALWWLWSGDNARELYAFQTNARQANDYAALLALKPVLDQQLQAPTVIAGSTMWFNDRLPSVSANVRSFALRSELNMWKLGNLEWDEARARFRALRRLVKGDASPQERLAILEKYQVEFIVAKAGNAWVTEILAAYPTRFEQIETRGELKLYRVLQP